MTDFADGEWHRLHRATPLFRGGLALLIIIGILFGNLRDRFIDLVFGDSPFDGSSAGDHDYEAEAFEFLIRENLLLLALAGLLVLLALITAGFWLSWRLHTFRITDEVVEVRRVDPVELHRARRWWARRPRPCLARFRFAARKATTRARDREHLEPYVFRRHHRLHFGVFQGAAQRRGAFRPRRVSA